MDSVQLRDLIRNHFAAGMFHVPIDAFASPHLKTLLEAFLPVDPFILTSATLDDSLTDRVVVAGTLAQPFLSMVNLQASVELSIVDSAAEAVIRLSGLPGGWKLSSSLTSLAGSPADDFTCEAAKLLLDSLNRQPLGPDFQMAFGYPASPPALESGIRRGLSFSARLKVGDALGDLAWLLGTDPIDVAGQIEIKADVCRLLLASQPGRAVSIGSFSLPLQLQLLSFFTAGSAADPLPFSCARLSATLEHETDAGQIEIPLAVEISSGDDLLARFRSGGGTALPLPLSRVSALLQGQSVEEAQTTDHGFPELDGLILDELAFTLLLGGSHRLLDISVGLRLEDEWSIFSNLVRFHDLRVLFTVTNPTAAPVLSATLLARAVIADKELDGYVILPDLTFGAELGEGEEIKISDLLQTLLPGPLELPEIRCTAFEVTGDVRASSYEIRATIAGDWVLYGKDQKKLAVTGMSLTVYTTEDGGVGGQIQGTLTVAGIDVVATATYLGADLGWTLEAKTDSGEEIDLTALLQELFGLFGFTLPANLPAIRLKDLYISHNTATGAFGFRADNTIASKIQLGEQAHSVDTWLDLLVTKDAQTGSRRYSGSLRGEITLGSAVFQAEFDLGAADVLKGWWAAGADGGALGFAALAQAHGVEHSLAAPGDIDLGLTRASFELDLTRGRFLLRAESASYGSAFFLASHANSAWDFVFGIALEPADIPGFPDLGPLTLRKVSLILSTVRDDSFKVPSLPPLVPPPATEGPVTAQPATKGGKGGAPGDSSRLDHPLLGAASMPLRPGVTLAGLLDLAASGDEDVVFGNFKKIANRSELIVQALLADPLSQSVLEADLDGGLTLAPGGGTGIVLANARAKIRLAPPGVTVSGTVFLPVGQDTVEATGSLVLTAEEMQALFDVRAEAGGQPAILSSPFGLAGVRLTELAVAVGVVFEPPGADLGLQGKLSVRGQPPGSNDFALLFELEGDLPNPLYLSAYVEELSLPLLVRAITGRRFGAGSLRWIRGEQLSVYWSERDGLVLPDGTLTRAGFGCNGFIRLGSFAAHARLQVDSQGGVSGDAEMSPIDWCGVLQLGGDGRGVSVTQEQIDGRWQTARKHPVASPEAPPPERDFQVIPPDGPTIAVNSHGSPSLAVSFRAKLLNLLSEDVEALVDQSQLTFTLDGQIGSEVRFGIAVLLDKDGCRGDAAFSLGIAGDVGPLRIRGVDLGTIHLDVSFDAGLQIHVTSSDFSVRVRGSFVFDGQTLTIAALNLGFDFTSFEELPGRILRRIRDTANQLFRYLLDEVRGMIGDAEDEAKAIARTVRDEVKKIADDAAQEADQIADLAEQAYQSLAAAATEVEEQAIGLENEASQTLQEAADEAQKIADDVAAEVAELSREAGALREEATAEVEKIAQAADRAIALLDPTAVLDAAQAEARRIEQEAENVYDNAVQAGREIAATVLSDAEELAQSLEQEAEEILDDLARAAEEAVDWVEKEASGAWDTISKY
jgi:hypothetical protein